MTLNRSVSALIALAVFTTLAVRILLRMTDDGESLSEAVWAIFRFYTIWTNTLIGLACGMIAVGKAKTPQHLSGLLLSIIVVAVVYHALLARLNDFSGLDAWVDDMLHSFIPIAFVVFWVVFTPKSTLRYTDVPIWLILPFVYCIYAIARAQVDGVYPYFFLNVADLGVPRTLLNILGLLIAFSGIGAGIVWLGHRLSRFDPQDDGLRA